jgi:UDP-glucuronate 4-epimerase
VISLLEKALGATAIKEYLPMQPGDVPATWADATELEHATGFRARVSVEEGVPRFVEWFRSYFNV